MKEQLRRLVELQRVDDKLLDTNKLLKSAPSQVQELDEQLEKFKVMLEKERQGLEETLTWQRQQERFLKEEQDRIQKTKQQLQQVKNAREYSAMQRQMEGAKKAVGDREEEIYRLMNAMEESKATLKRHEEEFAALEKEIREQKAEIQEKIDEAEAKKKAMSSQREEAAAGIEKKYLRKFERIAERLQPAIVEAVDGVCTGCHMSIRPQLYNILFRADSLEQCPRCQRFIYLESAVFDEEKGAGASSEDDAQ